MSSIGEQDLPFQHPKEIDISTNLRNTYGIHPPLLQFHRSPQRKWVHLDLAIWLKVCGRSHLNCLCLNRPMEISCLHQLLQIHFLASFSEEIRPVSECEWGIQLEE